MFETAGFWGQPFLVRRYWAASTEPCETLQPRLCIPETLYAYRPIRLKGGRLTNLTPYLHDLGNPTLTKHNSTYQSKPSPDKKGKADAIGHCYAKSPLYVERQLTQWDNWNANAIDERRSTLLEAKRKCTTGVMGDGSDLGVSGGTGTVGSGPWEDYGPACSGADDAEAFSRLPLRR